MKRANGAIDRPTDCALDSGAMSAIRTTLLVAVALASAAGCGGGSGPQGPKGHVIEIDIDDHGLAGLWMANAPNLKGLIARGTLAFSRVDVPTHSNQNNMTLLTGQYPEGHNVPANGWLSRAGGFVSPVNLPGARRRRLRAVGQEPAAHARRQRLRAPCTRAGGRTAYVGELPPFEVGADDVHLSIVGTTLRRDHRRRAERAACSSTTCSATRVGGRQGYTFDGPARPPARRSSTSRCATPPLTCATATPVPAYMFVWDFIALDDAERPRLRRRRRASVAAIIEDYDAGLGELLAALADQGLTRQHQHPVHARPRQGRHAQPGRARHATAPQRLDGRPTASWPRWSPRRARPAGSTPSSYALLNEDGDAQIYARVDGRGHGGGRGGAGRRHAQAAVA